MKIVTYLFALMLVCEATQSTDKNGNLAITVTKSFIEGHQREFQKAFHEEFEQMKLKDVRVFQKTDFVRLTALMNKITLVGLDFDYSHFQVDFTPGSESDSESCPNTEIGFKMTGVSMKFSFEQWLQVAS